MCPQPREGQGQKRGASLAGPRRDHQGDWGNARVDILPPVSHPVPSMWFSLDALARLFRAQAPEQDRPGLNPGPDTRQLFDLGRLLITLTLGFLPCEAEPTSRSCEN